jgi:PKD repeat protein
MIGITQGDPIGAANEYEIWRTTDGGNNWTMVPGANIPNPTAGEFGIVNVYTKQGTANIWFGTNSGRVYRSTDAGLNWSVSTLPTSISTNAYVTDLAFTTPLNGVCFLNNNGTFEMFNTTDGGATWTLLSPTPANVGLNDVSAVPGTNFLVSAGAGTGNTILSYSSDNGATWTDWLSVGIQYLTIDFADNVSGWAGSFSDQTNPSTGGIWKYNGPALSTASVAPTSAFSMPTLLCLSGPGATVTPVNSSTGSTPLTFSWSASPAALIATSTSSAPLMTFTANGTYTVTLEATNSITTNISTQVVNVITCAQPTAAFSAPTSTTCNKIAMNFTNTSSGSPTPTFSWTTTGSSTITPSSTSSNVAISFSTAGVYTVTLWAMNAQGTVSATQTVSISNCAPVAGFNVPTATQCTPAAITPTNTTAANSPAGGGPLTYSWSCTPSAGSISNVSAINPTITLVNAGNYTITLKATNTSGTMIATQQVSVSTCIGMEENSLNASNISVYPNPAKDQLNIEIPSNFSDNYTVTLTNILGKAILTDKVSNKEKINITFANIAKGVYFLTVESKGQKANKKIIVE